MHHHLTIIGFITMLGVAGLGIVPSAVGPGPQLGPALDQQSDSAAVVAVIDAFHTALERGDTAAVRRLLSEDVVVQEGGGVEDRAEYFSHHLPADMAFAGAVQGERRVVAVEVRGDVAWVASTSRRVGTFRDRPVDLQGAELIVLIREAEIWRISAIHWSSRSRS